jgi:hypothetical protein
MIGRSEKSSYAGLPGFTRLRTTRQADHPRRLLLLVLCLTVFLQMLGVPAPLLDPGEMFDSAEASVLEGAAIPPTCLQWAPSSRSTLIANSHSPIHVPLLALSLFHPPLF